MTEAEHELLARFAHELASEPPFEPDAESVHLASRPLPTRTPGEAAEAAETMPEPVGPRGIILDCGTSRIAGYTHVLWISPRAESVLGSEGFERLGEIVGRVYGVTSFAWEGIERLHLAAGEIAWEDLLTEAREALGQYMAARR